MSQRLSSRVIQAISSSDRHDFAVSQSLDIAHWWLAKETPILAIELARALVADLERCTCRIEFTRKHALPRGMKAKPLLKLKRSHRGKGTKMVVQRGSAHACNLCQLLHAQGLFVVRTQPRNRLRCSMALISQRGNCAKACA